MNTLLPLTQMSPAGGCGCKLGPTALEAILAELDANSELRQVVTGMAERDDAAILDLGGSKQIVFTLDFATPIVNSPRDWGRIAASNALSDVYAMGGSPLAALNIVAWPDAVESQADLIEVLRGGQDSLRLAGAALVGGHSVADPVPKYGLAIIGVVDANAALLSSQGQDGDRLVLTKPIGTGVLSTAIKNELAPPMAVSEGIRWMKRLNDSAAAVARTHRIAAATDVTGFGLVGHTHELAHSSKLSARLDVMSIPKLAMTDELIKKGMAPDGARRNWAYARRFISDSDRASGNTQGVLSDPQTSGGLLLAVPPSKLSSVLKDLNTLEDCMASVIGQLTAGEPGRLELI